MCSTCSNTPTYCTGCKGSTENRKLDDTCGCNKGYYLSKDESDENICVICPERFGACSDENTGTECKGNNRKTLATHDCAC